MKCLIRPLPIVSVMAVCVAGLGAPVASAQCPANELAKLTASDAAQGDQFGNSVSTSGDLALIGAHNDLHAGVWSGSAYVYRFDPPGAPGSGWVQEQKLVASDAGWGDRFGYSVAISGDVSLVGARAHDDACNKYPFCESGAAYVFRYDPQTSQWIEEQKLLASDAFSGDVFGGAVAIDGGVAVIGASGDADAGQGSGSAYVFRFDKESGQWNEEAKLTASDAAPWDRFGFSVSVSGNLALIGAPTHDDVPNDSGSAYVFRFDPDTSEWIEEAKLTASDAAGFDKFGFSVSISGDVTVIGAWGDDDAGAGSGSAYVFRFDPDTSEWIEEAKLTASDAAASDTFGFSVSMSGDLALIGALGNSDAGLASGSAYIFRFNQQTGLWEEQAKLTASDAAVFAGFGGSVSMSAGRALVGAHNDGNSGQGEHDGPGAAYIIGGLSDCNDNGTLDICDIADGTSSDANANGIPDECEPPDCPADLDGDGSVGILDLLVLLSEWGTDPGGPPDFDGDGTVGILDLLALLANWGECP
ncbi:MAG: hypothetical protein IH889_03460 [Planctomycetes bacterium]|nr:hypothetical protein [Planctomycetota bacterium]